MPQIAHQKLANQQVLVGRMPSDMGRGSNVLCHTALISLGELDVGVGPGSKLLYRADMRTLEGFGIGSLGSSFSIHDIQDTVYEAISPVLEEIKELSTLSEGWDGYDALAPKHEAIEYATRWIEWLYRDILDLPLDWVEPSVTASAEGEVVFEWWKDIKSLTIYIGNRGVEYLKAWGVDMDTEMEDGPADSRDIRRALWKWLMS
jgi:hypothetical protein